ncbi:ribonucleoside-diphosphate reductase beta chain [Salinibacter ruber]|uniref:ribonucleotide-diphosphate reductase subunit beta n=1 Tax=Salinibacter ruber TaxID=146919 RepID=UPI002167CA6B|nr:ribonucleotide-diphosphate reductase subunit beta [Salinibacter ruber]MCS3629180.1 ribonucleoside-diphosphate reductase beta chain [Salinibacter ruber]MCS3827640.1 ribonucleoside-diphosphate reductase beta chain [Salinibacter ruber]MCS4146088.1 ribonucleoside-diphosphate reductase beta chain [Salinibacter ruber]
MSIFDERVNLKPYEYPHLLEFKTAIRQSYWVHNEFSFEGDVQDFRVNCTDAERSVIKKTMLAIAQVEVAVKTFWADIYDRLPVPEVGAVGMTFAESEVRHLDAYSHLLELLGLNDAFERIEEIPALIDRVEYLNSALEGTGSRDEQAFAHSILLFSIFIEHVSLFSQFLIMLSFDKHEKRFKGVANAVEATSKEEQIHGLFGVELMNIIREEHPEWFGPAFEQEVRAACEEAYDAEQKVLDWIFADGELDFLPRPVVDAFLRDKFNESLKNVDVDPIFEVDPEHLGETRWFYEEILLTKGNDFFSKRSTSYSKMTQSVSGDDLF